MSARGSLRDLRFDNSFVRDLPGDPEARNYRRQVRGALYSAVQPTPVPAPRVLAISPEVAALLDMDADSLRADRAAACLAGNDVTDAMTPFAACYGGHQFGSWAGQLGDGRAISLGEVVNGRGQRWELQLKGAGPTPYSRMGDGRAVLRSSVREFLCSEAMHHLGVPTTRALSLVTTGEQVVRDMFYDGHPRPEPGAVVCRVAPSFLRFGNFELLASRGDVDLLSALVSYAIRTHFPALWRSGGGGLNPELVAGWLAEISRRTAAMVTHWMRVGFVHGVMNTDNMSILGLTIDYGPYGWLEGFDPRWTPNTTDAQGRRYAFGNQAPVALWNLVRFANALVPVCPDTSLLEHALGAFEDTARRQQVEVMAAKLGLDTIDADDPLLSSLFELLQVAETDMTRFYRGLADVPTVEGTGNEALLAPIRGAWYADANAAVCGQAGAWLRRWAARVRSTGVPDDRRRARMNRMNPKYVLRNYLAQLAIDAAEKGDPSEILGLLDVMRRPYDEQPGREKYAAKRPEWARNRPGCSMLSCSS